MRCLGIACTAILVGMQTNYGQLWVIYIKVVCGLKKMSVLQAENHYDIEKSANGSLDIRKTWTNYINSSSSIKSGVPSAADAALLLLARLG